MANLEGKRTAPSHHSSYVALVDPFWESKPPTLAETEMTSPLQINGCKVNFHLGWPIL